jgi:tetratricopeptide (TPR) repeat protein
MTTLAHASSDFVDALRRGLDAYDEGDLERAYGIFDEALEIEPDNVWGLLWKGATAPSPDDSRLWLEQALAIDPDNEHAQAGLRWVEETLSVPDPSSQALRQGDAQDIALNDLEASEIEAERVLAEPVNWLDALDGLDETAPEEPESRHETPAGEEGAEKQGDSVVGWLGAAAGIVASAAGEIAERLQPEEEAPAEEDEAVIPVAEAEAISVDEVPPTPALEDQEPEPVLAEDEADALPEWLTQASDPVAGDVDLDELPDWLHEAPAAEADEESLDLPDWLTEMESQNQQQDIDELPDWLTDTGSLPAEVQNPGELPEWLRTPADEVITEDVDSLPDWLQDTSTVDVVGEEDALPDWLASDPAPAEQSDAFSGDTMELYRQGMVAYEEDRLDDAIVAFQQVIRHDPTHGEAYNYLGSVFFLAERPQEAIDALRRALELRPDYTESYLNLGLVYKETGHSDDALSMFRRYLELAPKDDDTGGYVRDLIQELGG